MYQAVLLKYPSSIGKGCVSDSNENNIYIEERGDRRCYLTSNENEAHFSVVNTSNQLIHFLAIDGCMLTSSTKQKRCDCAVFNDSTFCFIEIKRRHGKQGKILKEAKAQLKQTIDLFKQEFIELADYELEAFISLGRGSLDPSFNASLQASILAFEDSTDAVLYIDDKKEFE